MFLTLSIFNQKEIFPQENSASDHTDFPIFFPENEAFSSKIFKTLTT